MSTISSRQTKRQALIDPLFMLVFLVLVLALLVFAPLDSGVYTPAGSAWRLVDRSPASLAPNSLVSFTSDLQYWEASCSHGWSSDALCDQIVARSESCVASLASAYCSAYERYLGQFRN